jgi:hypothetical protein
LCLKIRNKSVYPTPGGIVVPGIGRTVDGNALGAGPREEKVDAHRVDDGL